MCVHSACYRVGSCDCYYSYSTPGINFELHTHTYTHISVMNSILTVDEGYSQAHSLTFVDELGLEYGGDTQGIGDYVYDDFTLPSQTQSSQSQVSQQVQGPPGMYANCVYTSHVRCL